MGGRVLWIIQRCWGFVSLFLRWPDCVHSHIRKCSDPDVKYQNRHLSLITFHLSPVCTWRGVTARITVTKNVPVVKLHVYSCLHFHPLMTTIKHHDSSLHASINNVLPWIYFKKAWQDTPELRLHLTLWTYWLISHACNMRCAYINTQEHTWVSLQSRWSRSSLNLP